MDVSRGGVHTLQAAVRNGEDGYPTQLTSFDPYFKLGSDEASVPGLTSIRKVFVQDIPPHQLADELQSGDEQRGTPILLRD